MRSCTGHSEFNGPEDVAVVFLGGRKFVLQDDSDAFINGMKSRLVVMLNSEDSATTFRQGSAKQWVDELIDLR